MPTVYTHTNTLAIEPTKIKFLFVWCALISKRQIKKQRNNPSALRMANSTNCTNHTTLESMLSTVPSATGIIKLIDVVVVVVSGINSPELTVVSVVSVVLVGVSIAYTITAYVVIIIIKLIGIGGVLLTDTIIVKFC